MTDRISAANYFPAHRQLPARTFVYESPTAANRQRSNYRVDQSYHRYNDVVSDSRSSRAVDRRVRPLASGDLLGSMIQQMGGARIPSAKGTFVDISV